MNLQFLPRTLMIFGATLAVLGCIFHLLDKRTSDLSRLYEKQWAFYLVIIVFLAFSIIVTLLINGILRP